MAGINSVMLAFERRMIRGDAFRPVGGTINRRHAHAAEAQLRTAVQFTLIDDIAFSTLLGLVHRRAVATGQYMRSFFVRQSVAFCTGCWKNAQ